jgi:hypothetical protein
MYAMFVLGDFFTKDRLNVIRHNTSSEIPKTEKGNQLSFNNLLTV